MVGGEPTACCLRIAYSDVHVDIGTLPIRYWNGGSGGLKRPIVRFWVAGHSGVAARAHVAPFAQASRHVDQLNGFALPHRGSCRQPVAAIVCRCTVGIIGLRINHGLVKVTLIVTLGLPDAFPVAVSW